MPYVNQEARDRIDRGHCPETVGELTYELQQLVQRYLLRLNRPLHYSDHAEVLAALKGCEADFIDRILLPYEATKAAENGDVWDARLIATNRIAEGVAPLDFQRRMECGVTAMHDAHPWSSSGRDYWCPAR